jgi:hypothetical protein
MLIALNLMYRFNIILLKIQAGFATEIHKMIPQYIWKCKRP